MVLTALYGFCMHLKEFLLNINLGVGKIHYAKLLSPVVVQFYTPTSNM